MSKVNEAFDAVLSELMAAKVTIGEFQARERYVHSSPAAREIELLRTSEATLQKILADLRKNNEAAESAVVRLYDDAEKAAVIAAASGLSEGVEAAEKVRASIALARKFIDPIPF